MKTLDVSWVEELKQQVKVDMLYWPLAEEMEILDAALQDLMQSLKPEQQLILQAYLTHQKKMEVCLTRISYRLGEHRASLGSLGLQ